MNQYNKVILAYLCFLTFMPTHLYSLKTKLAVFLMFLIILAIVYSQNKHIEKFSLSSAEEEELSKLLYDREAVQNIASVYNNGTLTVDNIVATGNLSVTGNTTIGGTTAISGATSTGTLQVNGNSNISGNEIVQGTGLVNGTMQINGLTTMNGNLAMYPADGWASSIMMYGKYGGNNLNPVVLQSSYNPNGNTRTVPTLQVSPSVSTNIFELWGPNAGNNPPAVPITNGIPPPGVVGGSQIAWMYNDNNGYSNQNNVGGMTWPVKNGPQDPSGGNGAIGWPVNIT